FRSQVRTRHPSFHNVALADAGARSNPLVVGVDDFLEVRVGHHFRRNVPGYTRDFCRDAVGHNAPCEWEPETTKLNFMRCFAALIGFDAHELCNLTKLQGAAASSATQSHCLVGARFSASQRARYIMPLPLTRRSSTRRNGLRLK